MIGGAFNLPSNREIRTLMSISKKKKEKVRFSDTIIFNLSYRCVNFIKINPYKRKKMANTLKSLGITDTPEMVYAKAFVRSSFYAGLGLVLIVVHPLFTGVLVYYAIQSFMKEIKKTDHLMRARREKIEQELPRFVGTITQEIKQRQDVLGILIDYRKYTDSILGEELEITIADMKTSDYENAISRLNARVGSSLLSDIIQGLIAILRGDDMLIYFENLSIQLRAFEKTRLKMEMLKRPPKMKKYTIFLLITFLMIIFYAIGYDIMNTLPNIF
ncbi:hypothetical protein AKG39_06495 [Acetobacterium bakii]|uniref:Secretion protein F n=2 Tax=Acetobacterium bakii TaxID=52689 RepID=A0A0L6U293_9FIRM|nr:hypothetical protein AKG39_06495 [Acetobacterium bakii]